MYICASNYLLIQYEYNYITTLQNMHFNWKQLSKSQEDKAGLNETGLDSI